MNKEKTLLTWKNCLKVTFCAFLLFIGIYYWKSITALLSLALSAAAPVIIGLAIAYVVNILMTFYERHYFKKKANKKFVQKTRRPVCLVGAILTLLGVIALIVWLVVPELVLCVKFLISEIPPLIENFLTSRFAKEVVPKDILSTLASIDWLSYVTKIIDTVSKGMGDAVGVVVRALTSVASVVVTSLLSVIFSIYLLTGKDTLRSQCKRLMTSYLPEKINNRLIYTLSVFNDSFHGYIVGQCTEAVILGVLCTVGMLIFRFPYAAMIGALVGFSALIPVAGAYIGAGVGAVMMLTKSPLTALLFLVFIVVLQQLEGNLIYPKVVGGSIGLPAIWVLWAVTVGGGLFGVLGMLLGVPVVAALYRLLREDMKRKEDKRKLATETDCE